MYFLAYNPFEYENDLQVFRPLLKDANGHFYEGFVNADGEYEGPGFMIEAGFESVTEGFWKEGKRDGQGI